MATSATVETPHVQAGSRVWWFELTWSTTWSGNTATVTWAVYARCQTGTSGQSHVGNNGFNGAMNGQEMGGYSGDFYKDRLLKSGSFTATGGSWFSAWVGGSPYGVYTGAEWSWTLDVKVQTPTVTCSATRGLNSIAASMTVTNNGGAAIVDNYIDLFSDSACTNKVGTITGTSGTFTGLTPNTTYYARANASNGTYRGYSSVVTVSTYNKATISNAPNIDHGNNLAITYANPSGAAMQIGLYKTDGTTAIAAYRTCTGTSYTFSFTDAELDTIYKLYGNSNSIQARVYLKTANTYYDYKTITITLKGNQKTMREKVNGAWKRGKVHIKVSGTWKKGVIWQKVNGTWKRGI